MKIRLIHKWGQWPVGHVLEPANNVAGELIRRGTAEEVRDITVAEEVPVTETACMGASDETAMQEPPLKRGRGRPRKHPLPAREAVK